MSCFDELRAVATRQNQVGDFPDWLLKEVLEIPDNQGQHYVESLVTLLASQIEDYDSFAGSGCFGEAVSDETIQTTIRKIRAEI
jgi:hypothetical protein